MITDDMLHFVNGSNLTQPEFYRAIADTPPGKTLVLILDSQNLPPISPKLSDMFMTGRERRIIERRISGNG